MKRICFCLIFCLALVSCAHIKDDMPVQILAQSLGEEIEGFENLAEASSDYIKYCTESDLSLYSEYIVLYPFAGTEYNEIGIFKLKNKESIDAAVTEIKKYLYFKKANWDTRYMGSEFTKIEKAKICTCGKYILYTILDDEESNSVIKKFKTELK